jgi:biotin operon repressor
MVVAQLVYTCSRTNSLNPIRNSELSKLGISRFAKYKAIARLEEAGLIEVDRRNGRTLSVRLLWMPPVSVSNTCRPT